MELLGVFSGADMIYTYPNGDQVCIVCITYICQDFHGEMLAESDETAELKWFDIDDLPKQINPTDKRPLQAFLENVRKG